MTESLIALFERDMQRLKEDLEHYSEEEAIWKIEGKIINPGGNLVLHICGNLNHFIGAVLGDTGYQRNRELEFSGKGISRRDLLKQIDKTREMIAEVLSGLSPEDLKRVYPIELFGKPMTTGFFLMHLYGHLNWHRGHLNYHRRLVDVG